MSLPISDIALKYNAGASLHEIAAQYNTYPNKILRLLKKIGVTIRGKGEAQSIAFKKGRKTHPTAGKKRTSEDRLKISETLEKYYEQMPQAGYNKIVSRAKKQWKKIPKEIKEMMQKRSAESNRKAAKEGSAVEKHVKIFLEENGFVVDFHKKGLLHTELEVDLYLPKESVAIEIDGPSHYEPIYGEDHLQKRIKYDTEKNGILLSLGLVLIRVKYMRSKLTLGIKNKLKQEILSLLKTIRQNFPPENERLIEVKIS
jgi:very-short-patch-repair endonuclease